MNSADLLLHPVRLRIIQAFLGGRKLTTTELSTEMSEVPTGSLYRQVARLVSGGVLSVVDERRVRGAIERTYVLRSASIGVNREDLVKMSKDDHRQLFLSYVAGLIGDFDRYLASGPVDLERDGVSYRVQGMWLNESELERLTEEMVAVLRPRMESKPHKGRKRWILGTIVMPGQPS